MTAVQEYIDKLPDDRKHGMKELRKVILSLLPKGFEEVMNYGIPSFEVPHSSYPGRIPL